MTAGISVYPCQHKNGPPLASLNAEWKSNNGLPRPLSRQRQERRPTAGVATRYPPSKPFRFLVGDKPQQWQYCTILPAASQAYNGGNLGQ